MADKLTISMRDGSALNVRGIVQLNDFTFRGTAINDGREDGRVFTGEVLLSLSGMRDAPSVPRVTRTKRAPKADKGGDAE